VSERILVGRAGICISLLRPGRYSGPSDWFSLGPVGDWTSDLSYPNQGTLLSLLSSVDPSAPYWTLLTINPVLLLCFVI